MERKIGEIFEYNGEWHQCVEQPEKYDKTVCNLCDFHGIGNCELDRCSGTYRSDKKDVIFKKLEKVGPYRRWLSPFNSIMVQRYRLYGRDVIMPDEPYMYFNAIYNIIEIELKENKEDMEEYKMYDAKEDIPEFDKVVDECLFGKQELKLKPFDLQKAKEGKPVCTRDGRKARIICFDRDWDMHIVALVTGPTGESVHCYLSNGRAEFDKQNEEDLMMSPERKSGWVNIYRGQVYNTFEKAEEARKIAEHGGDNCLKTIKIDWEE